MIIQVYIPCTQRYLKASHKEEERARETSVNPWCVFYHACAGISLTTAKVLVTWDKTEQPGLHDNKCGLRNTGMKCQQTTRGKFRKCGCVFMKARLGGRQMSLFFPSFSLAVRDLCQEGKVYKVFFKDLISRCLVKTLQENFKSGFFFIEGVFYNDRRDPLSRDYSK